jgi:hypothetical protein
MPELMNGVVEPVLEQADLMRDAGVVWVRMGGGQPFVDGIGGELNKRYVRRREALRRTAEAGFRIVAVTPGPGVARWVPGDDGDLELKWRTHLPDWFGELGSPEFMTTYREVCAWLAEDLKGIAEAWQVANELDWKQFRGPQTPDQACDMILAGAEGLKSVDPSLIVGHNLSGIHGEFVQLFCNRLFGDDSPLDYCGIDGYFGSWHEGGPEDWGETIAVLHEKTARPVLLNEWGFASAGGVKTAEDHRSGLSTCQIHKWPHTWGPGHTPEGQAEFVARVFDVLIEQRDKLMGQLFFRWADCPTCWQCGAPDCPAETAWGLTRLDGQPKPSYYAYKEGVGRLLEA